MPDIEVVAPALSTNQDDSTFSYDKVQAVEKRRPHLRMKDEQDHDELVQKIRAYYNVDEIVERLKEEVDGSRRFKRITLQFPDELICDSATIVHELQRELGIQLGDESTSAECGDNCCESSEDNQSCCKTTPKAKETPAENVPQKIWILADTSYSPCCIDEVAAEHVSSDLVIHFGDACLNAIEKLPAFYVFGRPPVDFDNLVQEFQKRYPLEDSAESKILLMANSPYTSALQKLYTTLKKDYVNLAFADLFIDPQSKVQIIGYQPEKPQHPVKELNRVLTGIELQDDQDMGELLSEYELFHITTPEAPRLLQLTTRFSSVTIYKPYEKQVSQGPYPNLMRRYRYIQTARTAGTIGLLVNTLSLANTKKLINSIGKKIKDAGKKHYNFVVGKPNVAKLANFENVDLWCVLGCDHQGIIVDQTNEYFKPIVTPYELLLALSDDLTWTGKWETDFEKLLNYMSLEVESEQVEDNDDDDDEDQPPEFNPVTGQYVSTSRPLRQLNHLRISFEAENSDPNDTSLIKKFSSTIAIKNTVSTSAAHLQTRHWTGLGSDYKTENSDEEVDEKGALVEEGRGGIARGYDYDREVHHT